MNLYESTVKKKEDGVPFNQERILNETKKMEKTPKITNFKLEKVEYSDNSKSSENSEESQSESENSTNSSSIDTESSTSSTSSSRGSSLDRKSKKEKKKDIDKKSDKRKSRSKYVVEKSKTCHIGISSLKINTTIKEFHGRGKERVEDWLYTVDRVFKGCGIISDENKVLQANSFLRDVALHNFKALERTKKDISWSDFSKHKTKKYKPTDHEFKLREKLKNLKAKRDISSYVKEFRILMNQISSMDETDKISYFTYGLSGLTSGYVKFCKPKTLDKAIEVAENYEAFKMLENPKNADIFFAGSKSGFKVKLKNKHYLYKHKKDQKYKSDHKQGSSKPNIEKKEKNNKRNTSERKNKKCKNVKFDIEKTTETPVMSNPYRQANTVNNELRAEVKKMLDAGIIRSGKAGTWASPAFLIKQKGGSRFVVDYRKLNSMTKPFLHKIVF
ncbi:unnamed protein product [Brachionus calyciflorus]|uniref:Retrotransposon gag domain-containing protein n=1 Tax=Brachionus calyciflorus TaxID=104777 RepID=A0A814RHM9_9BILA|nr:unnamed protein product [Brachionus calyciflorus]